MLYLDFETRSTIDLREAGLANYAAHPSTEPLCLGYGFNDDAIGMIPFHPAVGGLNPGKSDEIDAVCAHIAVGGIVIAHNAAFELAIWNEIMAKRFGWPRLRPEQVLCTMTMAYAMGMPGALEKLLPALGLNIKKDMVGHRLMLQMCQPKDIVNGVPIWWEDADRLKRLYDYCAVDVDGERQAFKRLVPLSPEERAVWVLDQKINARGVFVDQQSVKAAIAITNTEQDRLAKDIRAATDNAVGLPSEIAKIKSWVKSRGVSVAGLAKQDIVELLKKDDLPADVANVLRIRQEAGKTSTAKLRPMITAASVDGRLRGMFQYHGAATGRWAGRRVQLHNLPRQKWKQKYLDLLFDALKGDPEQARRYIETVWGPPMSIVSECLRGMLRAAPGNELMAADFSNIEGRVLAWLAGEEWKLGAFRDFDAGRGPDIYKLTASRVLGKPIEEVNDQDRQESGKVPELALGYQGGVGAFQTMAKTYGVKISDQRAEEIKQMWRELHPQIKQYWWDLEAAAIAAVQKPGLVSSAGPAGREVKYVVRGSFLWCRLPSGRVLCYPYPAVWKAAWVKFSDGKSKSVVGRDGYHIERRANEIAADRQVSIEGISDPRPILTYMTVVDSNARKKTEVLEDPANGGDWWRVSTYGGSLSENVTQAVSRDILVYSMWNAETAFSTVMHVHDEDVVEIPATAPPESLDRFLKLMAIVPPWASGLPIAVAGWRGTRYRK